MVRDETAAQLGTPRAGTPGRRERPPLGALLRGPETVTHGRNPEAARYLPQLDGLRCCAVLLVLWQHAGPRVGIRVLYQYGIGIWGVWLFFVLSAFLISGILLRARDAGIRAALRRFYARRVRRIIPAYWVFLFAAILLGVPFVRGELAAHLVYFTHGMVGGPPWPGATDHLWSLAVEEQFYIVWPAIVLLLPMRWIPRVLVVAGLGGVVLRATLPALPGTTLIGIECAMPGALDSFALGGLLAYGWHTRPRRRFALAPVALAGVVLALAAGDGFWRFVTMPLAIALISVWLVDRAARSEWPVLQWAPIRGIGRISYGVYLYHALVIYALAAAPLRAGSAVYMLTVVMLTLAVSALSFRYLERPILAHA